MPDEFPVVEILARLNAIDRSVTIAGVACREMNADVCQYQLENISYQVSQLFKNCPSGWGLQELLIKHAAKEADNAG